MGNQGTIQQKFNKYIDFSIKINKICYLPGEVIKGTLDLKGKPGLIETQLNEPKAYFQIVEMQESKQSGKKGFNDYITYILYKQNIMFDTFIGANLLTRITISFSIHIPTFAHPTCTFKYNSYINGYVKHFFIVGFSDLKLRRILSIVIKNNANFTAQNKLL